MPAPSQAFFGPGLMRFLRQLQKHNDRAWFEANKVRYESEVREPALALIRAFEPRLEKLSPHFIASDKKVGGSLMRIYRDVRFSKDKSPYKTNVGIQFRHEEGKDVHAPGFYLHVEPTGCFLGAGMWHPDTPTLKAVRDAIVADPAGWKKVRDGKTLRRHWEITGDSLKRPPRGYDAEHAFVEDLKRKDHIAVADLDDEILTSPDLLKFLVQHFKAALPYMRYLGEAQGLSV